MTSLAAVSTLSSSEIELALKNAAELSRSLQQISSYYFMPISNGIRTLGKAFVEQEAQTWKEIVRLLQFHDIIRQRLEHVEELLLGVMPELRSVACITNLDSTLYLVILPKLVELNTAQLLAIDQEFQSSTQALASVMADARLKGWELPLEGDQAESFHSFSSTAAKAIGVLHSLRSKLNYTALDTNISLEHVENLYTMESERQVFYQVFQRSVKNTDTDIVELF